MVEADNNLVKLAGLLEQKIYEDEEFFGKQMEFFLEQF